MAGSLRTVVHALQDEFDERDNALAKKVQATSTVENLTGQQTQILRSIVEGKLNRETAWPRQTNLALTSPVISASRTSRMVSRYGLKCASQDVG
ncbi:hypothetical protein [Alteraurantiacibacter aquimixticola]|uniref:Uncharacterized protein n=1 Tax=Alteraurantiacibacter aquimixticola TaxID=2489173 RepID=A0A4T3F305_9SPHN|nr:hypothetical protein [Alteraurantiacibacter aquimixticola]TIX49815.1 hypothetical protein E5222_13495 [Alteraurantiacibacter aquimixticola]